MNSSIIECHDCLLNPLSTKVPLAASFIIAFTKWRRFVSFHETLVASFTTVTGSAMFASCFVVILVSKCCVEKSDVKLVCCRLFKMQRKLF
jgi:hypothetical protein